MAKQKPKQNGETRIKEARCFVRLGRKSVLIDFKRTTYITSISLLEQLIEGSLKTKEGKKSKAIQVSIIEDGELDTNTNVFLTVKDKAVYFVPEENEVLIASKDSFEKLLSGDWDWVKMGKIVKK